MFYIKGCCEKTIEIIGVQSLYLSVGYDYEFKDVLIGINLF